MIITRPNFFVFSGGPGVGKTTLIRHLAGLGELTVEETARAIIREELAAGGQGVPWLDNDRYVRLTAARDTATFDRLADESRRVFFDRGIIDSYRANGAPATPQIVEAIRTRRYNPKVFVFPPWREIYQTDAERRQDWPAAATTFDRVLAQLAELDYSPVIVPIGDVASRAAFVLERTA